MANGIVRECWRAVLGYEGVCEVSDQGRVRTLDHLVMRRNGSPMPVAGRILSASRGPHGHLRVYFRPSGTSVKAYVHRLVLLAFVGEAPEGMECRHLDGDAGNNMLDNLCWGTRTENMQDAGLECHNTLIRGERHKGAKLTERAVAI